MLKRVAFCKRRAPGVCTPSLVKRGGARVAALLAALGLASACERAAEAPMDRSPVRYHRAPAAPPLDPAEAGLLERLGYLTGYREASGEGGVSLHDPARAWPGPSLYSSGHAPVAILMDLRGEELHRWEIAYRDAFPDASQEILARDGTRFLRRVALQDDGSLLAVFDYFGLVKLDRDSRVIWARAIPAHHDLFDAGDRPFATPLLSALKRRRVDRLPVAGRGRTREQQNEGQVEAVHRIVLSRVDRRRSAGS